MSEMSYARQLIKGNRVDRAHMRQAENEHCYGEQPSTIRLGVLNAVGSLLWDCDA